MNDQQLEELLDKLVECVSIHQKIIHDLTERVHELEKAEKKNKKWFS